MVKNTNWWEQDTHIFELGFLHPSHQIIYRSHQIIYIYIHMYIYIYIYIYIYMYRHIQQIEYYVVIANQQCWHANKTWNLYSSNAGIQGNVRKQPVQNIHTHSMHIYHWSTVWLYSQTCIFQIHIFGCCLHRFHKIVHIDIYTCVLE